MEQVKNIHLPNHYMNILDGFYSLKNNEMFCDMKIICGDKIFSAHKMVLSVHSEYFAKILKAVSCQCPVIVFKEFSASQMALILQYIYEGEVKVLYPRVKGFMEAASYLQIKGYDSYANETNMIDSVNHESAQRGAAVPVTKLDKTDVIPTYSGCRNDDREVAENEVQSSVLNLRIKEPIVIKSLTDNSSLVSYNEQNLQRGSVNPENTKPKKSNPTKKTQLRSTDALCCPYCDKRFRNTSHRKEHIRIHTGEKPYTCTLCSSTFRHSKSLGRHQKIKHPSLIVVNKSNNR